MEGHQVPFLEPDRYEHISRRDDREEQVASGHSGSRSKGDIPA